MTLLDLLDDIILVGIRPAIPIVCSLEATVDGEGIDNDEQFNQMIQEVKNDASDEEEAHKMTKYDA